MKRFVMAILAVVMWVSGAGAQSITQRIDALQMRGGHLPGAYLQNPQAAGLVWYFAAIGAHAVALDGRHDKQVLAYLDSYLGTATRPGGSINDVHNLTNPQVIEWKLADSDDSYAGSLLSLASWYATRPNGAQWFREKLPQLKFIATANLLDAIDPVTKLTSTFNTQRDRFTAPLPAGQKYHDGHEADATNKERLRKVCYLMDNCEAYRGLKDFADRLAQLGDPDAPKYAKAAATLARGIAGLYDPNLKAFQVSNTPAGKVKFYPHRLIQVAPQVYGVDLGENTKVMYDDAWAYLNAGGDKWWVGQIADGSTNGAPFMILAYAAALRRDTAKATSQLEFFQAALARRGTPLEFGAINELGWALRATMPVK